MASSKVGEVVGPLNVSKGVKGHSLSQHYAITRGKELVMTFVENMSAISTFEVWDAAYQTAS